MNGITLYTVTKDNKVRVWAGQVNLYKNDVKVNLDTPLTDDIIAKIETTTGILTWYALSCILYHDKDTLNYFSNHYDKKKKYKLTDKTPTIISQGRNLG